MSNQRLDAWGAFRYTLVQGQALEAVGDALKRRRIDFAAATELRDLVRAGRVEEVMAALDVSADTKVTPTESAGYSGTLG
jgi:hypothetical protein